MGSASQKDRPDINGCWHGKAFRIEMKSEDNGYKASTGQKINLRKWSNAGAVCFIAYSLKDVKRRINKERCE